MTTTPIERLRATLLQIETEARVLDIGPSEKLLLAGALPHLLKRGLGQVDGPGDLVVGRLLSLMQALQEPAHRTWVTVEDGTEVDGDWNVVLQGGEWLRSAKTQKSAQRIREGIVDQLVCLASELVGKRYDREAASDKRAKLTSDDSGLR